MRKSSGREENISFSTALHTESVFHFSMVEAEIQQAQEKSIDLRRKVHVILRLKFDLIHHGADAAHIAMDVRHYISHLQYVQMLHILVLINPGSFLSCSLNL